jgi:hypothetical protein
VNGVRDWSQFRFTLARWLIPRHDESNLIAIYQPVSLEPNEDWTDSLPTAIKWLQSGEKKTISIERAAEGSGE